MQVLATPAALELIRAAGGQLFLWQELVGGSWAIDRQGYEQPDVCVQFDLYGANGFRLLLDRSLARPAELRLSEGRWPRRRLRIEWDGEPWGRRGEIRQSD